MATTTNTSMRERQAKAAKMSARVFARNEKAAAEKRANTEKEDAKEEAKALFDAVAEAIDHASTGDKQAVAFLRGVSDTRAVAFIAKLDGSRAEQPGIDDAESYLPPAPTTDAFEDAAGTVLEVATAEKAAALKAERPSTAHVYAIKTAYTCGADDAQKRALVAQTIAAFGPIAAGVVRLALRKLNGEGEALIEAIKAAPLPAVATRTRGGSVRAAEPVLVDGKFTTERAVLKNRHGTVYVGGFRVPFPAGARVRITVELA